MFLGTLSEGHTILGFGSAVGMAAWKRDSLTLAIRQIGLDAATSGAVVSVTVAEGFAPKHVFTVDQGFVVLLCRWDWQNRDVSWTGLLFEPGGRAHAPVDIGLAGMDIRVGQVLDGQRVGLVVAAASVAAQQLPGRWQTLTVGPDGQLTATATAVAVDDLVTTTNDAWEPAELADKRGWLVTRAGVRQPEGVFDGARMSAAAAAPLLPSDGLVGEVHNAATPPPRGPGGTIFEALGRPTLARSHNGKAVGEALELEWRGNPVGAIGMNIEPLLCWSGSHFIYPFRDGKGAHLLPIDCRP